MEDGHGIDKSGMATPRMMRREVLGRKALGKASSMVDPENEDLPCFGVHDLHIECVVGYTDWVHI